MADLLFDMENSSEFDIAGQDDDQHHHHQQQQQQQQHKTGSGAKATSAAGAAAAADEDLDHDPELESIRQKVREMEAEAERLRMMQSDMEKPMAPGAVAALPAAVMMTDEERLDTDSRSVYVGNVDYGATAEELETHFHPCGAINRITILCNKYTGQPKGFAYIEFAEKDSVEAALALDESLFRSRSLKVMPKRTNTPGMSLTNRPPRGARGFRGRMARIYGAGVGMAPRGPRFRRRPPPFWYAPY